MGVSRRAGRAAALLSCVTAARATPPVLGGYDVVAYFSLAKDADGVMGSRAFAMNFSTVDRSGGAAPAPLGAYEFWFASAANKAKFAADPWAYAPKYGGF